ncbi:septal ring lytic transglycosylase RlpA family protein [Marichromatium gracile]|uniref:Endolytic peptidoglycan transglycosylase RlpA n=1 Tax=Marichromatium gracile TaxID=1048 RepID=A0A4R4A9T2_MARGR|nr:MULTISPECIES: septal ring lytic transglycosylase RlpA family protein [Marichromatium]MBO8084999.1 septal ring lytic transglycosylase RlpA family protein [Marichromatium sp.]MBK1708524.1 septal ring lytic transglycosylase RlpA family lipoprotein [Marichromatium gracile]MCF1183094.1 septal ring lytic transglycosylase RlpA family protein [Marichromatium gracile]RNE89923.1 septal ring lytic transglycosylase RlpA family protein [Marichromatium sp. AB31]RNE94200.1 septal ring lytic transglycosyla
MHRIPGILRSGALAALLVLPAAQVSAKVTPGDVQKGIASYYHDSLHGLPTASGTPYDKNRLSAAHKTLPLGTKVRVTDTATGKSIVVRINDRGPFIKGRIIDLSRAAAAKLDMLHKGLARVRVEILSVPGRRGS